MNVGLIDVDGHNFPNLALMKISAYEKQRGNHVEWWNGLKRYDRVYKSKDMGYDPYVMIYDKPAAPVITRRLQRWCNNRMIFKSQPDFSKYNG